MASDSRDDCVNSLANVVSQRLVHPLEHQQQQQDVDHVSSTSIDHNPPLKTLGITVNDSELTDTFQSMNDSKWHGLSKRLRSMVAVKNAMVEPMKGKRASVEQKDSFLEKFSTRDTHSQHVRSQQRLSRVAHSDNKKISRVIINDAATPVGEVVNVLPENGKAIPAAGEGLGIEQEPGGDCNDHAPATGNRVGSKVCCERIEHVWNLILEPYSTFTYIWNYILVTAIHYNCWVLLLRVAFTTTQHQFATGFMLLDYVFDIIYMTDIFVSTRTSYLSNGIYVVDKKLVFRKYAKSYWFIIDVVSLLPFDMFYGWNGINPLWRLPRIVKSCKILKAKKIIESVTVYPNVVRALFLLHLVFLLIHWNACFYFMISKEEGLGSNSWVYPAPNGIYAEPFYQYVTCLYWSTLALTTIGESNGPQTATANIYMIVCYITGVFIFATIVGQAGSVIQNMNSGRMDFERQRDNTMIYMKNNRVPIELQRRVRLWYDYTYSRGRFQGGTDINDVTLLPNKMKTELALHVHLETLRRVTFLQKCPPEFLHDLVLKMKMHIFTPGDYICKKGEVSREMYVVSDGILEVLSEKQNILKVLHPGDFFGEIGILSLSDGQNRRTADVRSCGYVELFVLSKEDVLSATVDYPQAQKILANYGRSRLLKGGKNTAGLRDDTSSESDNGEQHKPGPEVTVTAVAASPKRKLVSRESFVRDSVESHRKRITNWHSSMKRKKEVKQESSIEKGITSIMSSFVSPACPEVSRVAKDDFASDTATQSEGLDVDMKLSSRTDLMVDSLFQFANPTRQGDKTDSLWMESLNHAHGEAIKTLRTHFKRQMRKEIKRLRSNLEEQRKINATQQEEIEALRTFRSSPKTRPGNMLQLDVTDAAFEIQKKNLRIQELETRIKALEGNRSPSSNEDTTHAPLSSHNNSIRF